jgi:hypothetical protein
MQENIQYQIIQQRPLNSAASADGVLSDQVVRLAGMTHPTRLVIVRTDVHSKRTRKGNIPSSGQMLLLCNDLWLAPELISLLYRYRWTIEVCHPYCLHCHTFDESFGQGLGRVSSAA